ncbi:xylulokinase [Rothia kristinae]|uniref:Xylulose kinase n=1 Tax=Rothia kristinae TaxID=37923 RepID=A0A199NR79_9MICC|nr:xylulokinase [Rothia kristinae]MBG7587624.1 xylulokinase [Rothia kristinae]OAX51599.1 xylulose kinase [Rothia kristinae]
MSTCVLGVDSSTQSCKALLVDADTGEVLERRRAAHPPGTEVDPAAWSQALHQVTADLLPRASAVAVAGQQHGMILLDEAGRVIRPALLWNDVRSAPQARRLTEHLGGPQEAARRIGSVPVASYTATKVRWVRENEPENARRIAAVALPHDWLTRELSNGDQLWTDHGEASGTAWYDPAARRWLPEIASWAAGHDIALPRLAAPHQAVGTTSSGAVLAPGTGDNAAAALGLGMVPGDVCVSLGTSAVVSVVSETPAQDGTGAVSGFADATGRYLPLATTLNGAPVLDRVARLLGTDHDGLAELALAAPSGADGAVFIPYFAGERTPDLPEARAQLLQMGAGFGRKTLARAAVEGLACSVLEALEKVLDQTGARAQRVLLVGGGAGSGALRTILAGILGRDLEVPDPEEFVALGAARQAAWVLSGATQPPRWSAARTRIVRADPTPGVYERYLEARNRIYPEGSPHT